LEVGSVFSERDEPLLWSWRLRPPLAEPGPNVYSRWGADPTRTRSLALPPWPRDRWTCCRRSRRASSRAWAPKRSVAARSSARWLGVSCAPRAAASSSAAARCSCDRCSSVDAWPPAEPPPRPPREFPSEVSGRSAGGKTAGSASVDCDIVAVTCNTPRGGSDDMPSAWGKLRGVIPN
jgi:hypothetical protein